MVLKRSAAKLLAVVVVGLGFTTTAAAQTPPPQDFDANQAEVNAGEVVNLEDQLLNGLRCVTDEQRIYVHQVVALVEQGKLPRAMVNVIYKYALKRNPHVPLPYFQIALQMLAERRGVTTPTATFFK